MRVEISFLLIYVFRRVQIGGKRLNLESSIQNHSISFNLIENIQHYLTYNRIKISCLPDVA